MPAAPVVLNYGRPSSPGWRRIVKWTVRIILIAGLVAGMGWGAKTVWQSWERYRYQQNWIAATAALTQITLPPDTIVVTPAGGRVTYKKPYTFAYGHGTAPTPTIPIDPTVESQLRAIGWGSSLSSYPIASELQTGRGKAFVRASIVVHNLVGGSSYMWMSVEDLTMRPGTFPFYQYRISGYGTGLRIVPSEGRTLPTVYIGQIDPDRSGWTLPLRVDGKPEWVRFDHSGPTWPIVTASFGQLVPSGSQWELKY